MAFLPNKNVCVLLTTTYVLLFFFTGINSQDVSFTTDSDTVIAGQPVELSCFLDGFSLSNDRAEISVDNMVVLVFDNGIFMQQNIPSAEPYTTETIQTDTELAGILLLINAVTEADAGQYQCAITTSGQTYQSQTIDISVRTFPQPSCFGQSNAEVIFDQETGVVNAKEGSSVSIVCFADTGTNSVAVTLGWSRSDGRPVMQSSNFSPAMVSVTPSGNDNFAVFSCTATNSQYEDIMKTCSFQLFVSRKFHNNTSTGTPNGISSTMTPAATDAPLPIGIIAGAGGAGGLLLLVVIAALCVCCIRHAKRKGHSSHDDSFDDSMEDFNNTTGYLPADPVQSQRNRISYENGGISMDDNNGHSRTVPSRPSSSRFSYGNSAASMNDTNETLDSTAQASLRRPPPPASERFSYENSAVPTSENEYASRPPSLTVPLRPPVAVRTSYENSDPATKFPFPPIQNDLNNPGMAINSNGRSVAADATDGNLENVVAEYDSTHDVDSNRTSKNVNTKKRVSNGVALPGLYSEVPFENHVSTSAKDRSHENDLPIYAQSQVRGGGKTRSPAHAKDASQSLNRLPVYAAVDKSRGSVSSLSLNRLSVDEGIPSYAAVDKNRIRKSIDEVRTPSPARGSAGFHYADVEFSEPPATSTPSHSSGTALYDSVPETHL